MKKALYMQTSVIVVMALCSLLVLAGTAHGEITYDADEGKCYSWEDYTRWGNGWRVGTPAPCPNRRPDYFITLDEEWAIMSPIYPSDIEWRSGTTVTIKQIKEEKKMLSFMFGVLGSGLFWVAFFVVGFFIGSLVLKHCAKHVYKLITIPNFKQDKDGYKLIFSDILGYVFIVIGIYLFWPFILPFILIAFVIKHLIMSVVWPLFVKGVKTSVSIVPDIEIKRKEKSE